MDPCSFLICGRPSAHFCVMSHDEPLVLERYRKLVEEIAGRYIDAEVVLVPSIAEWMISIGASVQEASGDRNRLGKSLWGSPSARDTIVLRTPLTRDDVSTYCLYLELRRFRRAHLLNQSVECLKHLVLHEVAHIKHDWRQDREKDCDRWAFNQLKRWA